mmetsp:Transcript_7573/g.11358  ORF Transcript_7573/g.11358 Transcript_7573/m.11358 type:complete len:191 (-) Transcript_7573:2296-2868(-)
MSNKRKSCDHSENEESSLLVEEEIEGIILEIDDLEVLFPFERVYKEQIQYMIELKTILDANGDGLLEMPTGTGKTICLLSLIIAYKHAHPEKVKKLIYCTRTVSEMDQCLKELKKLCKYRNYVATKRIRTKENKFVALCLSSRKNLCIHPRVSQEDRDKVDIECRKMTASWSRQNVSEKTIGSKKIMWLF